VEEGVTGFVPRDTAGFAEAIQRLQADAALRATMGAAARQHACENSWNLVFDQVHAAYAAHLPAR
jgi:phosphatidylinositol alpha 1,6-mannosyltransferase